MKVPATTVAFSAAAAAMPAMSERAINDTTPAQILMASSGQIQVAEYDGQSFTTTLNAPVSGAPTWVEFVEPNLLYAVDENGSELRLFHLDLDSRKHHRQRRTPKLSEPVATATGSSGVVHLAFNPDKTRMVGAGYGAGTIDIWNIEGEQLSLIKTITSDGQTGPVSPNQDSAHPHQSVLDPTGRYFLVNDLGTDSVLVIDSADDAWEVVHTLAAPAACGPRHGVFSVDGDSTYYFALCELSNQILRYTVSYADGGVSSELLGTTDSIKGGNVQGAAAGEIALGPDGSSLYVSNRLLNDRDEDNLTRFQIQQGGGLAVQDEVPSGGKLPRMFSIDGEGATLFVGNQNGPDAAAAFGLADDGSLATEASATMPLSDFGGEGFGPAYIKRIR
ncbi:hypothetical protein ACO1O0_007707 [Amphichorda felina]